MVNVRNAVNISKLFPEPCKINAVKLHYAVSCLAEKGPLQNINLAPQEAAYKDRLRSTARFLKTSEHARTIAFIKNYIYSQWVILEQVADLALRH